VRGHGGVSFLGRAGGLVDAGAEGERCGVHAEHVAHDGGNGVAVFLGGDADEVPGGGGFPEYGGDALERDEFAQLRCPPDFFARVFDLLCKRVT